MKPFERDIFEEKILRTAIITDEATLYEISLLAKDARTFLKNKNIEVTEMQSYILLITALIYKGNAPMDAIFRRNIAVRKTFFRKKNIEEQIKNNSVFVLDPAAQEPE